jgi:hypothetical protein
MLSSCYRVSSLPVLLVSGGTIDLTWIELLRFFHVSVRANNLLPWAKKEKHTGNILFAHPHFQNTYRLLNVIG